MRILSSSTGARFLVGVLPHLAAFGLAVRALYGGPDGVFHPAISGAATLWLWAFIMGASVRLEHRRLLYCSAGLAACAITGLLELYEGIQVAAAGVVCFHWTLIARRWRDPDETAAVDTVDRGSGRKV